MESNEDTKVVIDLFSAANKLCGLLRNKIHFDGLEVFQIPDVGINAQTLTPEDVLNITKPMCWWLPAPDGAVGVLVCPLRNVWFDKNKHALSLPSKDGELSVWFCNLTGNGIPLVAPLFGLVPENWNVTSGIRLCHLEPFDSEKTPEESKAVQRSHKNWGQIALKCFVSTLLGCNKVIHENNSSAVS
jgi:hypothetical protein